MCICSLTSYRVANVVGVLILFDGNLQRTVMEAVTKILGGGLHVGVRVQGKKVRDDNKTLLQTGISNENQLGSLGFSLEPNPSKSSSFLYPVDSPHLFAGGASQHLTR